MPVDWKLYEKDVIDQYVNGGKNADDTIEYLRQARGADITVRQFKTKFGGLKKLRADEWKAVFCEVRKREAQGVASDIYLYGRLLPQERVAREKRRYMKNCDGPRSHEIDLGIETNGKHRLEIRNPNEPHTGSRREDRHRRREPETQEHADLDTPEARHNEYLERPADEWIDVIPTTPWDLVDLDLSTLRPENHAVPDFDLEPPNAETTVVRIGSSPRLHSEVNLAPQFNNELGLKINIPRSPFGLSLPSPDLRMSTNILAWPGQIFTSFWDTNEIISLIGSRDLSLDNQPYTAGNEMHTRIPWEKPGYIFSHLMSIDPRLKTLESSATLVEQVLATSPVSYRNRRGRVEPGRFSKEPQKLLDQSFSIMAYLIANNFFQEPEIDALVRWAMEDGRGDQLRKFLHTNSEHIRSCAAKILSICPDFGKVATLATRNLFDLGRPLGAVHGRGFRNFRKLDLLKQAIDHDNLEQADLLVSNGVSLNRCVAVWASCKDPLSYAVRWGSLKMVKLLIRAGADLYLALEVAIDDGQVAMADALLKKEAECNDGFFSRVHHRLEYMKTAHPDMYQTLKERNCKGFRVFEMFQAAEKGKTALFRFIVEQQITEDDLEDGLCEGVKYGNRRAVSAFLRRGVNPNTGSRLVMKYGGELGDVKCRCLIQLAMQNDKDGSSLVYVHLLINAGAEMRNEYLVDLCRLAIDENEPDFMLLLVQRGYDMSLIGPSVLEYMARDNRIYICESLLIAGAPVNGYGVGGMSALQAAAREGNLELMEYLVDQGADINLPAGDYGGKTALQAAASQGEDFAVEWLIKAGADIKAVPAIHNGVTVLEAAARGVKFPKGRYSFRKLLALGAPVNRPDGANSILLHELIRNDNVRGLRLALEAGARLEDRWTSGAAVTPLQMAAGRGNREAILLLLSYGADINAQAGDYYGITALQAAAQTADIETVQLLIIHGAEINAPAGNEYSRTALQAATSSYILDPAIVSLLLDHGADVNAMPSNKGGITALQGAAIKGDVQIARLLLNNDADVNAAPASEEGRTAVEGAAEHGRMDMVRLLLNAGAKPDPIHGFSRAIELADENDHFVIGDLLEQVEESFLSTDWSDSLTPWSLLEGMAIAEEQVMAES